MDTKGGKGGGMDWETETDIHTTAKYKIDD